MGNGVEARAKDAWSACALAPSRWGAANTRAQAPAAHLLQRRQRPVKGDPAHALGAEQVRGLVLALHREAVEHVGG